MRVKIDDDNSLELSKQLQDLGLTLKEIAGDGNCMFRALSDQLRGTPNDHFEIRKLICNHIIENQELYNVFLDEEINAYCTRMRKTGVYGGNLELVAASRVFDVGIAVHQAGQDIWLVSENQKVIHIAYHSWEHYSSVRNINGPHHGIPKIVMKSSKSGKSNSNSKAGKKAWDKTSTDPITKIEKNILNQMGFGVDKLGHVRELLVKYRGDPTKVLDQLYEEQDALFEGDFPALDGDTVTDAIVQVDADAKDTVQDEPKDTVEEPKEEPWQVVKPKKVSKRDKKELKRREKMLKNKPKVTEEVEVMNLNENIKMLSI